MSSSRESSQPRDRTLISCVPCSAGRYFTAEPQAKPEFSDGPRKTEDKTVNLLGSFNGPEPGGPELTMRK